MSDQITGTHVRRQGQPLEYRGVVRPPDSVAAWAAKSVLEDMGRLADAEAAAGAISSSWRWRFREATRWERASVLPLAGLLGLTPTEVDAWLIEARRREEA